MIKGVTPHASASSHPCGHFASTAAATPANPDAVPVPVQSAALARPSHPALEAHDATWTARELADDAAKLAATLQAEANVQPGDVVALLGPPCSEWVLALHALGWLGATVAPLPREATNAERAQALQALHAVEPVKLALLVGDTSNDDDEFLRKYVSVTQHTRALRQGAQGYEPLPERFWPLPERRALLLTSGTTAAPRAVAITTAQLLFNTFGTASRVGHLPSDRWLCVLPLNHIGGLAILYRCAWLGITVRLPARFDAHEVAQDLDSGDVALISLVPTMLERVLDARRERDGTQADAPLPKSLRAILLGGARTPQPLRKRCRDMAAPVALTWGMSETASQVATRYPGDLDEAPPGAPPLPFVRITTATEASVGRASLPARHAAANPSANAEHKPTNELSPINVSGPQAPGGNFKTNDVGYITEHGRVHVTGRRDDIIISGGKNIAPEEIEESLRQHPAIKEAVVVGIPDRHWGEAVVAVLVPPYGADALRSGGDAAVDLEAGGGSGGHGGPPYGELRVFVRSRLAGYKVPRWFVYWPGGASTLPRTGIGKVRRSAVRAQLLADPAAFGLPAFEVGEHAEPP